MRILFKPSSSTLMLVDHLAPKYGATVYQSTNDNKAKAVFEAARQKVWAARRWGQVSTESARLICEKAANAFQEDKR